MYEHNGNDEPTFSATFNIALKVARQLIQEQEGNPTFAPRETEIRRRCCCTLLKLWHLGVLRCHGLTEEEVPLENVPLPSNVNDVDLASVSEEMPKAREGLTEMSFCLANFEVVQLSSNLILLDRALKSSGDLASNNARRSALVHGAVRKIETDYLWQCHTSRPLDWFLMLTSKAILVRPSWDNRNLFHAEPSDKCPESH